MCAKSNILITKTLEGEIIYAKLTQMSFSTMRRVLCSVKYRWIMVNIKTQQ